MKLKSATFAGVLAASLAMPVFANDAVPSVDALPQFTAADTQMLFEQDATPMQLAALSPQEMRETEGSFIWNGVIGGAIGLGTYAYNNWGNMTWGGALGSTALGVASGYGIGSLAKAVSYATGPLNAWVRIGSSYSKTYQIPTYSIRWGSNNYYQQQIGSSTLRSVNNYLHNTRLPGSSWRVQDKGHFHLRGR